MSDYVLDTDTCIYWLNGEGKIRRKVEQVGPDNLRLTIITLAELRYGAYNSQNVSENLKNIDNFLRKVRVLPLDHDAADRFGKIKVDLRKKGQIIEDFDVLINCIESWRSVSHKQCRAFEKNNCSELRELAGRIEQLGKG